MLSLRGLIVAGLLVTSINGGDITLWETTTCWSTIEKEAVTYWSTSTYWTTQWSTVPPETLYNTIWSTYVQPTTYTSLETTTETITQYIYSTLNNFVTNTAIETQTSRQTATETITQFIYSTLNNFVTNTATETQISQQTATEIGTLTQLGTVTATATITSASVLVQTLYSTITQACTTPSLTGLVLCPYRDVNPTYTPPGPLPTNYLWGCPPGTLCTPKKVNCNFERDYPADTYFCDPNDCVVPPPLPADLSGDWIDFNCTPLIPLDGYPVLSPIPFGLDYSIFEFNGQPGHSCPPPAPPAPPAPPPPPPPPPASTWSSQAPPPPTSTWSSQAPPPLASTWAGWSSAITPSPAQSSTWTDWSSPPVPPSPATSSWQARGSQSYGKSHSWSGESSAPTITARAELADRDLADRDLADRDLAERDTYDIPSPCYTPCSKAGDEALNCQKVYEQLCPPLSPFILNYNNCGACISSLKTTPINGPPVALISTFAQFINYCNSNSPTSALQEITTTTPSTTSPSTTTPSRTTPSTTTPSTTTPSTTTPSTTTPPTTTPSTTTPPTTTPSTTTPSTTTPSTTTPSKTTPSTTTPSTTPTTTPSGSSPSSSTSSLSTASFTGSAVVNSRANTVAVALVIVLTLLLNYI